MRRACAALAMFWWGKKRDEDEGPRAAPAPVRSGSKRQKEKLVEATFPLPPVREPFKPSKLDIEDKRVYDYVRFHTAENIWYYRCVWWGRVHWV